MSINWAYLVLPIFLITLVNCLDAKKVSPSVIVASVEGEVSSLNMVDDFKVQMGPTSVGKKLTPRQFLALERRVRLHYFF